MGVTETHTVLETKIAVSGIFDFLARQESES